MTNETLNFNVGDKVYLLRTIYDTEERMLANATLHRVEKVYKNGQFILNCSKQRYRQNGSSTSQFMSAPRVKQATPEFTAKVEAAKREKACQVKREKYFRLLEKHSDASEVVRVLEANFPFLTTL